MAQQTRATLVSSVESKPRIPRVDSVSDAQAGPVQLLAQGRLGVYRSCQDSWLDEPAMPPGFTIRNDDAAETGRTAGGRHEIERGKPPRLPNGDLHVDHRSPPLRCAARRY